MKTLWNWFWFVFFFVTSLIFLIAGVDSIYFMISLKGVWWWDLIHFAVYCEGMAAILGFMGYHFYKKVKPCLLSDGETQ